ncbi:hypothetical protein AM588_10011426 [Phytophthora nicotianae]|uniref:HAT C-terminal dimerisation domain-containing protein n=1 Tax=Phytophthora nicotianae TaxID=4792 RepID=A0A0W8DJ81_PHYNI|nr:hypothetical protein AM588_10011426 [Phytophthora nicotianae]
MVMVLEYGNAVLRLCDKRFKRFQESDLVWVAYLVPRVAKYMNHLSEDAKPQAQTQLINAAVALARKENLLLQRSAFLSPQQRSAESEGLISDFLYGPPKRTESQVSLSQACKVDFTRYLADVSAPNAIDRATDPFKLWRLNHTNYVHLSKLARK